MAPGALNSTVNTHRNHQLWARAPPCSRQPCSLPLFAHPSSLAPPSLSLFSPPSLLPFFASFLLQLCVELTHAGYCPCPGDTGGPPAQPREHLFWGDREHANMGPTWWSRRAVPWAVSGDGAGHKAERCSRACKGCSAAGFLDRPLQPGTPSRELASSTPPVLPSPHNHAAPLHAFGFGACSVPFAGFYWFVRTPVYRGGTEAHSCSRSQSHTEADPRPLHCG